MLIPFISSTILSNQKQQIISLHIVKKPISFVIEEIKNQSGISIEIDSRIKAWPVTILVKDMNVLDFLKLFASNFNCDVIKQDSNSKFQYRIQLKKDSQLWIKIYKSVYDKASEEAKNTFGEQMYQKWKQHWLEHPDQEGAKIINSLPLDIAPKMAQDFSHSLPNHTGTMVVPYVDYPIKISSETLNASGKNIIDTILNKRLEEKPNPNLNTNKYDIDFWIMTGDVCSIQFVSTKRDEFGGGGINFGFASFNQPYSQYNQIKREIILKNLSKITLPSFFTGKTSLDKNSENKLREPRDRLKGSFTSFEAFNQ